MTEWGYQALIEDIEGRKIELKDEEIKVVATYQIQDVFKLMGRGIVFCGIILKGDISLSDEISFVTNNIRRVRKIKGIDVGMRKLPLKEPFTTGLMIQCVDDNEIDELRQWKPENQNALIIKR